MTAPGLLTLIVIEVLPVVAGTVALWRYGRRDAELHPEPVAEPRRPVEPHEQPTTMLPRARFPPAPPGSTFPRHRAPPPPAGAVPDQRRPPDDFPPHRGTL
ncbi:hypothetical protein [Amycolatopsis sp. CA-128772]|uniref:hypothetical protein n=1 Tax=Amycolatopsis sp. CA-128772 TaxID=2073159 RepID=UPI000CD124E9|nr:hypothetical protein [Amycolatopsis sp. CA-128772]